MPKAKKDTLGLLAGLPKLRRRKAVAKVIKPEPMEPAGVTAEKEISALKKAFIERSDRENERYTAAVDSCYWLCVCFQSREQKNQFLKQSGLHVFGQNQYIDGKHIARKLGIVLPAALPSKPLKKIDPKLSSLAMELEK